MVEPPCCCTQPLSAATPAREVLLDVAFDACCARRGWGRGAWAPIADGRIGTTLSTAPGLILAWLRGERSVGTVGRSVGRRRWCDAPGTTPTPRAVSARTRPSSTRKRKRGTRRGRCSTAEVGRGRASRGGGGDGIGDVWERDCSRLSRKNGRGGEGKCSRAGKIAVGWNWWEFRTKRILFFFFFFFLQRSMTVPSLATLSLFR